MDSTVLPAGIISRLAAAFRRKPVDAQNPGLSPELTTVYYWRGHRIDPSKIEYLKNTPSARQVSWRGVTFDPRLHQPASPTLAESAQSDQFKSCRGAPMNHDAGVHRHAGMQQAKPAAHAPWRSSLWALSTLRKVWNSPKE